MNKSVFLSILTRNHGNYLPHYLRCIEELDYDKKLITVYINTNNNDDDTLDQLLSWILKNQKYYKNIILDKGFDDPEINKNSTWDDKNGYRLFRMSQVRDRSIDICKLEKTDYYFVIDTDNWIAPFTLKYLIQKEKPIIAPFLKVFDESCIYSNYHLDVEWNGYRKVPDDLTPEIEIWMQKNPSTFKVPLVHCTYLIDCKHIEKISYHNDYWGKHHYEYVLFATNARENNIDQYFCNEKMFGFVRYNTIVDKPNCYDMLVEKLIQDNSKTL